MPSPDATPVLVVVTAAGRSERFGGSKKELAALGPGASSVLDAAVSPFLGLPRLAALVVTAPPGREDDLRAALAPATRDALEGRLGKRFMIVAGGASRRDSVLLACEALASGLGPGEADAVLLVHDGARPWASADLVARVALTAAERGSALPVTPLVDTPKEIGAEGLVLRHPPRASLAGAQTPQGFRFAPYLEALRLAAAAGIECTDDAEIWDRFVGPVQSLPGEAGNRKVTYPADLAAGSGAPEASRDAAREAAGFAAPAFRVGTGWDRHRLVPGRRLLAGGVELPSELGEDAHSDGDVLLHAIVDALLGAAALGDIGTHFPPSDEAWRGADSKVLARAALGLVRGAGWRPVNLDCTLCLERPKLGARREAMRASIADCLGMPVDAVSVKAKTGEGLDAVGELRAIEAQATVLLVRDSN